MKKILLSILALSFLVFVYAGNENEGRNSSAEKEAIEPIMLSGSIIDQVSSESLVGVEVQIEGTQIKTYTDFDGNFKFENLKPGNYNLVASYISYEKSKIENIDATKDGKRVKIELKTSK